MRREFGMKCEGELIFAQIHPRIVIDVCFRDSDPADPRDLRQQWQADQPVVVYAADLAHLILILIGGLKTVEDERIERRVFCVAELCQLVLDAHAVDGRLIRDDVAKRHSVVEGTDVN